MSNHWMVSVVLGAGTLSAAFGCGSRAAGVIDGTGGTGGSAGEKPGVPYTVETFASPLDIVAGTEVSAICVVSLDREYMPGVATRIVVSPDSTLSMTPKGANFTPTAAGAYTVRCETADGGVADHQGVAINVIAAPPAMVLTTLETPTAQAAAPVHVDCDVEDQYGNPIDLDQTGLLGILGIAAPADILVDPPAGPGLTVRGTVAGDYPIACTFGLPGDLITDLTPEVLTIIPGIPADTETLVSDTELSPTQTATVSCTVTDMYGNALTGVPTLVQLMADDGSPPSQNGLTLAGDTVSATAAGTYYVACKVDGYYAADESPAVVTVHPGLPDNWIVDLASQNCFWQDRGLPLLVIVYDAWGNEVDPADYLLNIWGTDGTGAPAPGAVVVDPISGAVRIANEGDYIVWVDMDAAVQQSATSTISPFSASIRVDSTPPVFDITSPARYDQVQQAAAAVAISGTITDGTSALASAQVNGSILLLSPGAMSVPVSETQVSDWGLNIITGEAVDECDNRRVIAQSYLRSGQYFNADVTGTDPSAQATSGLLAHLNQEVLDDPTSGGRSDLDDLATIAWMVISGMDLNAVVPNPLYTTRTSVTHSCPCFPDVWNTCNDTADQGFEVLKSGAFTYSTPSLDWILAMQDGLIAGLSISNLALPLWVWAGYNCSCCGDYSSSASATIRADLVWADAYLDIPSGSTLNVSCSNCVRLGFNNLRVTDVDWGWITDVLGFFGISLGDLITSILNPFQNQISGLIGNMLSGQIGPLVQGFLQGFNLGTSVSLPPPLSMALNLQSGLDYVKFSGPPMAPPYMDVCDPNRDGIGSCPTFNGYGELGLYTQLYPSSAWTGLPASARGVIRRRDVASDAPGSGPSYGADPSIDPVNGYPFGIGLEDDVLNQAMWALWYGGGLDLDVTQILQLSATSCSTDADCGTGFVCNASTCELNGVNLTLTAMLPPVVMPGSSGNQVNIGLGDAYVDATVDLGMLLGGTATGAPPLHVGMYLSAILGGRIDIDPATNVLHVCLPRSSDPMCPGGLPDAQVYVEVVAIDDEGYQGLMTDVFSGLLRLLLPDLLGSVVGSIPLPSFDLSGVGGLPAGTVLELTNASLRRPNTANTCSSGTEKLDATHLCMTGSLQSP